MKRLILIPLLICGSVYAQADAPKTTTVSAEDLKEYQFELSHPMFVRQFDANKDGNLDDAEKVAAVENLKKRKAQTKKLMEARAIEMITVYDADRDQKLSKDEIVASFEGMAKERKARMIEMMNKRKAENKTRDMSKGAPKKFKPPMKAPVPVEKK